MIFRKLTEAEEAKFRQWARENDPPKMEQWSIYHPVCRDEWVKRGIGVDQPACVDHEGSAFRFE